MHYFLLICAFIFPSSIFFFTEYSNFIIFSSICVFLLCIISGYKIYLQQEEIKRMEEYIEDIKDERNYIFDLIDKNANEMTFQQLKKYYGDYITNEEEIKQKEAERFKRMEEEYARDLKKYWEENGKYIKERLKKYE